MYVTSFSTLNLEPDVLECLCRGAVEVCCKPVVATPRREIATGDPRSCAMAGRAELLERRLRGDERRLGLVELVLLEQCATEDELGVPDLVEVILVTLQEAERMLGLLGRLLDVARAQVDLRERRHRLRRVLLEPVVERDRERFLQQRHRLVGLAEEEVQTAEVVREPADVDTVRELLVGGAGLLRVRAREHPMALAVCDE